MKTAGIVADNYKVERFKKELAAKGFNDVEVLPFTGTTSTIKIKCEESQYPEIMSICEQVEFHFKNAN